MEDKSYICLGRDKNNDIVIDEASISSHHLDIERIDQSYLWLYDKESSNGTFVNDRKIRSTRVSEKDQIRLGNYSLTFTDLQTLVNQFTNQFKKDFKEEFALILEEFEIYQKQKNKIDRPSIKLVFFRLGIGLALIIALLKFPNLIPESFTYPLIIGIGLLTVLANFFFNSNVKKAEKRDVLRLDYEEKLVCPKCSSKMIHQNLRYWQGKNSCNNAKCDAVLQ